MLRNNGEGAGLPGPLSAQEALKPRPGVWRSETPSHRHWQYPEGSFNGEHRVQTQADMNVSQSHNPNAARTQTRGDGEAESCCLLPTCPPPFVPKSLLQVKCYDWGSTRGEEQRRRAKFRSHSQGQQRAKVTRSPRPRNAPVSPKSKTVG